MRCYSIHKIMLKQAYNVNNIVVIVKWLLVQQIIVNKKSKHTCKIFLDSFVHLRRFASQHVSQTNASHYLFPTAPFDSHSYFYTYSDRVKHPVWPNTSTANI